MAKLKRRSLKLRSVGPKTRRIQVKDVGSIAKKLDIEFGDEVTISGKASKSRPKLTRVRGNDRISFAREVRINVSRDVENLSDKQLRSFGISRKNKFN